MVAPHVEYQHCYEAAKIGLASGNEIVSFPFPKCGAVCCDPLERAKELYAQHGCIFLQEQVVQVSTCAGESFGCVGLPTKRFHFVYFNFAS